MIAIPKAGNSLCKPQANSFIDYAQSNRENLNASPTLSYRKEWQTEVLKKAKEYMKKLGTELPAVIDNAPMIFSGHQPEPFHAGIIFKQKLLVKINPATANRLWVSVDSDPSNGYPVKIPSINGGGAVKLVEMLPSAKNEFHENALVNTGELREFAQIMKTEIKQLPDKRFDYGIDFMENALTLKSPEKMRALLMIWRTSYLSSFGSPIFEIPLSHICKTKYFYRFLFEMLSIADKTAKVFNSKLEKYRKEHSLRSKANPFPNLERRGDATETLFWVMDKNGRTPLFVTSTDAGFIMPNGETISSQGELETVCKNHAYKIRPRAVALSLMQRLYLSDLFIHGIGGAKYDVITDNLISNLFKIDPPKFAVASCTLDNDGLIDPSEKLAKLNQQKRDMKFHPEAHLEESDEVVAILAEKKLFVEDIKKKDADKKSIGNKISKLNEQLFNLLKPVMGKLVGEINETEKELKYYKMLTDREYPFFLSPPNKIPD